jgi:hypothetical protein
MTRQIDPVAALLSLLSVLTVAGCNGRSPAAPSPMPQAMAQNPAGIQIIGGVRNTSTWPCVGCRVEVLDGPRAGRRR